MLRPERPPMIVVAGSIQVDPGARDAFIEGSAEAIRLARATGACSDFAVSADPLDPGRVNVYELWDDRESLEAFRGDGPGDDLGAMVLGANVREFETT